MGRKLKEEGIYVYTWLMHFAVQQKLTQRCKATSPSKKGASSRKKDGLLWGQNSGLLGAEGPFKAISHPFISEAKLKQRLKLLCLPASPSEESGAKGLSPVSVACINGEQL